MTIFVNDSLTFLIFNQMAGQSRAVQEFVSCLTDHQEVIRAYIIGQIPGCTEVRDILQEVNILLWEKMRSFKPGSNFGAWACTVAYYKVLEYRRKQHKDRVLVFSDELAEKLSAESAEDQLQGIRGPGVFEEKRSALHYCLRKLPAQDRELLDARYGSSVGGMAELAATTGRSRASLRVSLNRLRHGLKDCINKRLAFEGGVG